MSSVVGLAADQIRIGMKVRARIDRAEDRAILLFEPADRDA